MRTLLDRIQDLEESLKFVIISVGITEPTEPKKRSLSLEESPPKEHIEGAYRVLEKEVLLEELEKSPESFIPILPALRSFGTIKRKKRKKITRVTPELIEKVSDQILLGYSRKRIMKGLKISSATLYRIVLSGRSFTTYKNLLKSYIEVKKAKK